MKIVNVSELKVTNIELFKEGINKFDVEVVTDYGSYRVPIQAFAPSRISDHKEMLRFWANCSTEWFPIHIYGLEIVNDLAGPRILPQNEVNKTKVMNDYD